MNRIDQYEHGQGAAAQVARSLRKRAGDWAVAGVFLLVALLNVLVWRGWLDPSGWILLPDRLRAGEWWRLFTYSFVHVSPYHFLLDAISVAMIEVNSIDRRPMRRLSVWLCCIVGSASAALGADPETAVRGLCGLSGAGHGLMIFWAIECMREAPALRTAGLVTLVVVVLKCAWEAMTGVILFDGIHPGMIGHPITVCHAGGVLGGLAAAIWTDGANRDVPATLERSQGGVPRFGIRRSALILPSIPAGSEKQVVNAFSELPK